MCSKCQNPGGMHSAVVQGTYYRDICINCLADLNADQAPTSGQASYNRQRDIEDHTADFVQPFTSEGKPNEDFRRLYPDKADRYFTDEQLRKSL